MLVGKPMLKLRHEAGDGADQKGSAAMPSSRAQQRCMRVTADVQAEAAARQASILTANKSGSCSRT